MIQEMLYQADCVAATEVCATERMCSIIHQADHKRGFNELRKLALC